MNNDQSRFISFEEMQRAGEYVMERVGAHRAVQMVLELAMHPREDVMYKVINEANELQAMSFR